MMFSISKFFRYKPCQVWLILGPSGVGKSYFSRFLAQHKNFLHLEVDTYSIEGLGSYNNEGIDIHNLRREWELFYTQKTGKPLVKEITRRSKRVKREGAILSFPSTVVLSLTHIKIMPQGVKVIYLFSERQFCINSFLQREKELGRGLGLMTWEPFNSSIYAALMDPTLQPHVVNVFNQDGTRKTTTMIYDQIMANIRGV